MTVAGLVHVWSALLFRMFVQMLDTAALKKLTVSKHAT